MVFKSYWLTRLPEAGKRGDKTDKTPRDAWRFVVVESALLEATIAVVRDRDMALPEEYRHLVRFTLAEMRLLEGAGPDAIRDACAVKKTFGPGTEVVGEN